MPYEEYPKENIQQPYFQSTSGLSQSEYTIPVAAHNLGDLGSTTMLPNPQRVETTTPPPPPLIDEGTPDPDLPDIINPSPIDTPLIPLLLFAGMYICRLFFRRRMTNI